MRSLILTGLSLLAATAVAAPWDIEERSYHEARTTSNCMSDSDAQKVADNFKTLIADYSESFANQTLSKDFADYSDSVSELINGGCTTGGEAILGQPTFSSLAEFEAGQGAQPAIPFEILNLWNACSVVTVRWRSALSPQIVTGIIVLEVEKNPDTTARKTQKWLIKTVYSEFNSGAWLVDLGIFTPPQCPPPTPDSLSTVM